MGANKKAAGKVPATNNTVPILYRHQESDLIEPIESAYEGRVPGQVWRNMNRRLLKLDAGRYFFPLDSMDAYAEAVNKVEDAAERIARGEIVLNKATPVTYLTGVAYKSFYRFHLRKVQPQREVYRRVERKITGRGATGEDGFDADNYDATESSASGAMRMACEDVTETNVASTSAMTAQQLAEALPGIPWARERARAAMQCLEDICDALNAAGPQYEIIVSAFAAYIVADGNLVEAAKLIKMSKTDFYRKWPTWLALAKKVGKKCVCRGTNCCRESKKAKRYK